MREGVKATHSVKTCFPRTERDCFHGRANLTLPFLLGAKPKSPWNLRTTFVRDRLKASTARRPSWKGSSIVHHSPGWGTAGGFSTRPHRDSRNLIADSPHPLTPQLCQARSRTGCQRRSQALLPLSPLSPPLGSAPYLASHPSCPSPLRSGTFGVAAGREDGVRRSEEVRQVTRKAFHLPAAKTHLCKSEG